MESTLNALGLGGGVVSIVTIVLLTVRKVLKSRCIRNEEGNIAVELSLNTTEIHTIQQDEVLKRMFADLKTEIQKSKRNINTP